MRLFIAGICGTFMAGIAQLAREAGHDVCGCDENVYPPMSTLLNSLDIPVLKGYSAAHLDQSYDRIIIGNALSRGNAVVETTLDRRLPYCSGPQWLNENYLTKRQVIAVAGTHGKTTTSSMVAWMMQGPEEVPGYLIGGKPGNFDQSALSGTSPWFVIEADEYDTAFFDKRSKFVHYCPTVALLNNLEFDHADIFADIAQIQTQFHHLLRIVPSVGRVVVNGDDPNLATVLDMGCWSRLVKFSLNDPAAHWYARAQTQDCSRFEVFHHGTPVDEISWSCLGRHNMANALGALAATGEAGIEVGQACRSLETFIPSRKRLEKLFESRRLTVYEDFAHHPTAIASTLEALRAHHPGCRLFCVLELRSNTMRMGHHGDTLGQVLNLADQAFIYDSGNHAKTSGDWDPATLAVQGKISLVGSVEDMLDSVLGSVTVDSVIVCMSNGGFDGIPAALAEQASRISVQ